MNQQFDWSTVAHVVEIPRVEGEYRSGMICKPQASLCSLVAGAVVRGFRTCISALECHLPRIAAPSSPEVHSREERIPESGERLMVMMTVLPHLPARRGSGRQMSMEQDKGPLLVDVGTPRGRPGIGAREIVGPWRRTIWTRLGKLQDSQGYP